MSSKSALVVAISVLGAPSVCVAQEQASPERAYQLRVAGQIEQALTVMEQVYRADPSPSNAAQLAALFQSHGDWVEAESLYRRAIAAVSDPWIVAHRGEIEEALRSCSARLATVVVDCPHDGAVLRFNGQIVGPRPFSLPHRVRAGDVQVTVEAPGRLPLQRLIRLEAGGTYRENVSLAPALAVREAIPIRLRLSSQNSTEARFDVRSVLGLSLVVAGGAVAGASIVGFALREDAAVRYNRVGCPPPTTPSLSGECASLLATESSWATLRWVFLGLAAGLLGGGSGVMIWSSRVWSAPRMASGCVFSAGSQEGHVRCSWTF